jgi:putative ABC transport system permease protein
MMGEERKAHTFHPSPLAFHPSAKETIMLKNYLVIAIRNLLRHKVYAFINTSGLAIGMACCILIFIYVTDEFSYDRDHEKTDQIYRLVGDLNRRDHMYESAATAPPMAPALREYFPQILHAARIAPATLRRNEALVSYQHQRFYEKRLGYADASIFEIFTLPLLQGDPKTALTEAYTIVISETMAAKYFGDDDPFGKTLTIENDAEYKITGVMKDMPHKSHFRFDFLASFVSLKREYGAMYDCWGCRMAYTYLLLPKGVPPNEIEKQIPVFLKKHVEPKAETMQLRLQPLADIHLRSSLANEIEPAGNLAYLYILAAIGIFILLMACINYMNLMTAHSAQRAKEIGVRKAVGANRLRVAAQFLGEAITLACLALPLALVLVELFLPQFNELAGKTLRLNYSGNSPAWLGLAGLALLVGFISGSYPAWFLSRFQPALVLKGRREVSAGGNVLRGALVVMQFAFSIALIITATIVIDQRDYLRNKKLGFDKEQTIVIPIRDGEVYKKYESLKAAFLQNPAIVRVSASSQVPPEKLYDLEVWPSEERQSGRRRMKIVVVEYDFFETLGMEIAAGRTFSKSFGTDAEAGLVLNESAVKAFGWDAALGKKLGAAWNDKQGTIIGVVKDFHFESLHQKIEPVMFFMESFHNYLLVRIHPTHNVETLSFLKEEWQKVAPHRPFEYSFLDAEFDRLYKSEEKLGSLFGYFSMLAIFIACLGLFGLAAFAAERRTKEIGIRKVLGASTASVVALLTKEFVKLVLMANIVAWPIAYFAMNRWLQEFAYRIDIGVLTFVLAGSVTLVIALLTVSFQSLRAALANPVEALRYE